MDGDMNIEGVREKGAKKDILDKERRDNKAVKKTKECGVSWSVILTTYWSVDEIKKTGMNSACRLYGERVVRIGPW